MRSLSVALRKQPTRERNGEMTRSGTKVDRTYRTAIAPLAAEAALALVTGAAGRCELVRARRGQVNRGGG
jgi:hypothetical protein